MSHSPSAPQDSASAARDLHAAFATAGDAPPDGASTGRIEFLAAVDALPGLAAARAELNRRAAPLDGATLVDAGCGLGLETARLAAAHPGVTIVGLDRDPGLLAVARDRAPAGLPNLLWRHGDVTALDLPAGSVDVLRAERVLIYVDELDRAIGSIARVLAPGGTFACFELDFGGILLAPGGLAPAALRALTACLEAALPQPWAGRRIPGAAAAHGLEVVAATPHCFAVDRVVFDRIVADTLRVAVADGRLVEDGLDAWLREVDEPGLPGVRAVFTGVVTAARRR